MFESQKKKKENYVKFYAAGLLTERQWTKTSLLIIFISWSIFSAIDIILNYLSLNGHRLSQRVFISLLILLVIRAICFFLYLECDQRAGNKFLQVFELIFVIIFAATAIFTWNAQISMDVNRSFIVGLDVAWILRYILIMFRQWKFKALMDTSVIIFGIVKFATIQTGFSMAYVQAALQMLYILGLLHSREKVQKMNFEKAFSMERTEETLKNILDNIPENIAVLDLNGDLVYYNKYLNVCFGIDKYEDGEINVFTRFYSVKLREKYFNFRMFTEARNSIRVLARKSTCRFLARKHTIRSYASNRFNSIHSKDINLRYSKPLNSSLNQNERGEEEVVNPGRKFRISTLLNFRKIRSVIKSPDKNPISAHFSAKTINSIEELTNVQEVINFFVGNMHVLRNHDHNLNNFYIFDCKYKEEEDMPPKSFEIKISLAEFDGEESFILILRDTTDRDTIATLEANDSFKNGVLQSISHELRTPLNTNLNLLEIAISSQNTPKLLKDNYLIPAHQTGKLLHSLIEDILDYSLIMAEKFVLNYKIKDLQDTLAKIKYLFESQARRKGIGFEVSVSKELSPDVYTDHKRLRQILTNLLSNALKFTTQGKISINIEPHDILPGVIEFNVADSGCGMDDDKVKVLQKKLRKIKSLTDSESLGGTGMGLMISNILAEQLSAADSGLYGLKFSSKIGEGTSFWFFIDTRSKFSPLVSPYIHPSQSIDDRVMENSKQLNKSSQSHIIAYHKDESVNTNSDNSYSGVKFVDTRHKLLNLATLDRYRMQTGTSTFWLFIIYKDTNLMQDGTLGDEEQVEDESACAAKDNNIKKNYAEINLFPDYQTRPLIMKLMANNLHAPTKQVTRQISFQRTEVLGNLLKFKLDFL